jgi:hypothetical protein
MGNRPLSDFQRALNGTRSIEPLLARVPQIGYQAKNSAKHIKSMSNLHLALSALVVVSGVDWAATTVRCPTTPTATPGSARVACDELGL